MIEYIDTGINGYKIYFPEPKEPTIEEKVTQALSFMASAKVSENGKIVKKGVLYANGDIKVKIVLCKNKRGKIGVHHKNRFYQIGEFIPVEPPMEQRYPHELVRCGDLSICGEWVEVEDGNDET